MSDLIEIKDANNNTLEFEWDQLQRMTAIMDTLGNVVALTDSSGDVVEEYRYDVFGYPEILDGNGNPVSEPMTPFLFAGREYDSKTGLYHYRTRAYSPELGRFLQPDSIDFQV